MLIRLERFSYSTTETEGELFIEKDGETYNFATIERPWIRNPNGARGGKPTESCIPDGLYTVRPWVRPNGDEVFILYAPELGVYRTPDQHEPGKGRNLILLHSANWSHQVNGCIAPGMTRIPLVFEGVARQAVSMSRSAMNMINNLLGREQPHVLEIVNSTGASDVRV